ncbi:MAG: hypothetical protein WCK89_25225 [bacterium]
MNSETQERPETFPEYLRRLADDCDENGNTGHAADHRASAGAIDLLVTALIGFLAIDDWHDDRIAPKELVARARAAIENVQTVENALE